MNEMIAKYPTTDTVWMYNTLLPFAWIIITVGSLAVGTFYIFPKNRRFPVSIAAWTVMLDVIDYTYELIKWGPYSQYHEFLNWNPNQAACKGLYAMCAFVDSGQALSTLFLSYTIYNSVVNKKDMSYDIDPRYFRVMVSLFCVYTAVWTFVIGVFPDYLLPDGKITICPITYHDRGYEYALMIQYGISVVLQIYLLGSSLRYIKQVWALAKSRHRHKDVYYARLQIRFVFLVALQSAPRITWHAVNIAASKGGLSTNVIRFDMCFLFVCYFLDILILFTINRPLIEYIKDKMGIVSSSSGTIRSGGGGGGANNVTPPSNSNNTPKPENVVLDVNNGEKQKEKVKENKKNTFQESPDFMRTTTELDSFISHSKTAV